MPERFLVASGDVELSGRSYAPASNDFPGAGVVMLHGIVSSADTFDAPGLEAMSLARAIQAAGIHAVSYDQRGAGDSTTQDWQFGLTEHALVDLPAVLAECRRRFGFERVVLLGHSLGGTIWHRYVAGPTGTTGATGPAHGALPRIVGGVVLASPADFDKSFPPWSDLFARGREFVESIDHNRDLIVAREEFVAAQIWLYWPRAAWIFRPWVVALNMRLGARFRFVARGLRTGPFPSLIYHRDDFDDATFQKVLQSKMLDRASAMLLREIGGEIFTPQPPPASAIDLDVLCIGSAQDGLVPLRSVEGFARRFKNARVLASETAYGVPSGHVGYLFKQGLRDRVAAEAVNYLRSALL